MKTPDEIKKGLEYCSLTDVAKIVKYAKRGIPYACVEDLIADALAYIQQLEAENTRRHEKIMQLYSANESLTGVIQTIAEESKAAFQRLEAQVTKWISVEERMPEISANAIVRFSDGYISLAQWWGDKWFKFCWRTSGKVTHWMPPPEPPEEE